MPAEEIQGWLIERVCAIFGLPASAVSAETAFDALGLDSITRAGLVREIEKKFRIRLDPEVTHEFPTIGALSRHLAGR